MLLLEAVREETHWLHPLQVDTAVDPLVGDALLLANGRRPNVGALTLPRKAKTTHEIGFYRLVVDNETAQILGATLVGPQAAELIHIISP